ncbi:thioesterase [Asticcacaulis sp. AC460]|uniref:PaaI family thioesterase n=1 Tax=Asticcacaulis sp. AC460 TaxID=1282360 RepID=UPI0003C3B255|nr:PaaI family thioesterase [Asticcacaulis sp. AC460]ESQ90773.1 thioesterase [Asticcacaulis sp. AC460]
MRTLEEINAWGQGTLPGHLGIRITHVTHGELHAELPIQPQVMAPNGYLHAGTVVSLADTAAGYGCIHSLPEGAVNFTTVELKSNHLATARDGTLEAVGKAVHMGRTTQVWDVTVTHRDTGKTVALFRCTQMLIYPK